MKAATAIRLVACVVLMTLVACQEIPQDARKPFAGPEETKGYLGETFKGDEELYDKTLARRAETQDEYSRLRPTDSGLQLSSQTIAAEGR